VLVVPDRAGRGDVVLVLVTDGQELVLGHDVLAAVLEMIFVHPGLDDGVHRTGLFTEAAVDALEQVDVVARRASRAVGAGLGLDGDGQRRTGRLAQLAGDAALLAVRIAAQRVQAAEARRNGRLLLRILDGELALEQVAAGQPHAAEELGEQQTVQVVACCFKHFG
jgi:hypothetical protein